MGTLIPKENTDSSRLLKFRTRLRHYCSSRKLFIEKVRICTLAIEAKLKNFKWVDMNKMQEVTEREICVRLAVEESSPKHIVLSVYPDRLGEIDPLTTPEVDHETVW